MAGPKAIHFAQVDAFTSKPFGGNPAAVIVLDGWKSATWMQKVAAEFNLAETAFLVRRRSPDDKGPAANDTLAFLYTPNTYHSAELATHSTSNEFELRWFTPTVEVDLCGHATLASAKAVFSAGLVSGSSIRFHTRSGVLVATKTTENGGAGKLELDLPAYEPIAEPRAEWGNFSAALGGAEVLSAVSGGKFFMVELSSEEAVRSFQPDFRKIAALDAIGIIITAQAALSSSGGIHFVSRMFAPQTGIDEDPVTGAAHCLLTPYWSAKLGLKTLKAQQVSQRTGDLEVRLDDATKRVFLKGEAVIVMAGALLESAIDEN